MKHRIRLAPFDIFLLLVLLGGIAFGVYSLSNSYQEMKTAVKGATYDPFTFTLRLQNCPSGLSSLVTPGTGLVETTEELPIGTVQEVLSVKKTPKLVFDQTQKKYVWNEVPTTEDIEVLVAAKGVRVNDMIKLDGDRMIRVGSTLYTRILSGGMATGIVVSMGRELEG